METNSYTSSSRRNHIWLKIAAFVIVFSLFIYNIGEYYEEIAKKNQNITDYKRAWDEFYDLSKDSIDLIFLGSSHAYCTFDPELIDRELGSNSFNFGSPLQFPDSTYHVFKEVLRYQKPDTLVYEIYWDMIDDEFDLTQADTVINAIDREGFKRDFIRDAFPLNEIAKYAFKPVRFQQDVFNYWNQGLKEKLEDRIDPIMTKREEGVSYHKGRGFIYSDIVIGEDKYQSSNQFRGFDGSEWEFDKGQKDYIERMVKLARERDIEIIFVTAPIANVSMEYIDNYHVLHDKIADFAHNLGVAYRDYNLVNMEKNLFENENFRDDAHLNYSGVEIFTDDFVNWYKKNE